MAQLLLDAMCGGLRGHLRMCGHDAAYALERDAEADEAVLALAADEGRTVVTRDRQLADRARDAILLTERDPVDQLAELAAAGLDLTLDAEPSRCGRCNGRLAPVDRADGETGVHEDHDDDPDASEDRDGDPDDPLPEYVPDDRAELWRCDDCGRYFWKGGHWERVERTLAEIRERAENE